MNGKNLDMKHYLQVQSQGYLWTSRKLSEENIPNIVTAALSGGQDQNPYFLLYIFCILKVFHSEHILLFY